MVVVVVVLVTVTVVVVIDSGAASCGAFVAANACSENRDGASADASSGVVVAGGRAEDFLELRFTFCFSRTLVEAAFDLGAALSRIVLRLLAVVAIFLPFLAGASAADIAEPGMGAVAELLLVK